MESGEGATIENASVVAVAMLMYEMENASKNPTARFNCN